jgi:hypothetical protein
MRYFTAEIWAEWQSSDDAVVRRAMMKWDRNIAAYRRHVHALAPRLGPSGRFFTDHSLHDGRLLSFQISDYPLRNIHRKSLRCESSVVISVLAWVKDNTEYIYTLRYEDILDISIDSKNDLFSERASRFGDWGYDELLQEGPDAFRHNILFATGTEMSVAFRQFRFRRWKGSNQRIQHIVSPLRGLPSADS